MKKFFLILGILIFGLYALSYIAIWLTVLVGSLFSENIYSNLQDFLSTLVLEGLVGFLVLTQVTVVPIISGWLSLFLYKKYKKIN
jgi:hypothetical protein|tara:strand:- start:102 stop:356 length:255 start_codon:yes stop_codon:yes gene_type:complete